MKIPDFGKDTKCRMAEHCSSSKFINNIILGNDRYIKGTQIENMANKMPIIQPSKKSYFHVFY